MTRAEETSVTESVLRTIFPDSNLSCVYIYGSPIDSHCCQIYKDELLIGTGKDWLEAIEDAKQTLMDK